MSRGIISDQFITGELISGFRCVHINSVGALERVLPVSGHMPAIGIVADNIESGQVATVIRDGLVHWTSGLVDVSGKIGRTMWNAHSGAVACASGQWASGGHGTFVQRLGVAVSGGMMVRIDPYVTNLIQANFFT
jgi:hypothetical protein